MDPVTLGYRDTAVHAASAAAVARVLEAHDLAVVSLALPADQPPVLPDAVGLFATAWLPLTDAALRGAGMQPLGVLYRPSFLWCVGGPAGDPHPEWPASLAELRHCAALERNILVAGTGPMAPLAASVLRAYGLDEAGFAIVPVSGAAARAWAEAAHPARIVPLCRPDPLLHAATLRVLHDPLHALGAEQEARLLIRPGLRARLDPDLIDELDELTLGHKVVSAMAHAMGARGLSAEAAADAWQRGKLTPRG